MKNLNENNLTEQSLIEWLQGQGIRGSGTFSLLVWRKGNQVPLNIIQ